jgi:hypothetical protein
LQAAVLGQPSHDELLIVGAISRIEAYNSSRAAITINGKHVTAKCRQRWNRRGHIETASLSDGQRLVEIRRRMVQTGMHAFDEFELVGCPQSLADWLASRLNRGEHIDLHPTRADREPVYVIRVQSDQSRFVLYLTRPGELPTRLAIDGPGIQGTSEVKLGRS